MMAQYLAVKAAHPDALLFYRMGDFYELFFDDAVAAAGALNLTLTKRGKHLGQDIPMCGMPIHSHEAYLARLIRHGFKVAVCEQLEDPAEAKKRKGVVKRDVVRLITPGTLTEESLLDARAHNYLAALALVQNEPGLAWLDISTGTFQVQAVTLPHLPAALARLAPGELLLPDRLLAQPEIMALLAPWKANLTPLPGPRFDSDNARRRLEQLYGVGTLAAFGTFTRAEVAAAGTLIDYVELTQKGKLPRLEPPKRLSAGAVMEIDAATRRNLEFTHSLSGERRGSLLSVIDRTVTGAGARLLAERLSAPLTDPAAIDARLDAIAFFVDGASARENLRDLLAACPDVERSLSRLTVGRGGPRDLAAVRDGLALTARLREVVTRVSALTPVPQSVQENLTALGHHETLVDRLVRALSAELPLLSRDGGFIAAGYDATLNELRALRDDSRRTIARLQATYAESTGISALKIRHNNVLGYYIEMPAKHGERLIAEDRGGTDGSARMRFVHRQTLANVMRFTTVELADLDDRIRSAADRTLALELTLFADLVKEVESRATEIAAAAAAMAALDVAGALAQLAVDHNYVRPLVDTGVAFAVTGGRHPVVEAALRADGGKSFVANDCILADVAADGTDAGRLWLITGPNMAGKSTFLRQNAVIAVMAQMGSFVPASSAHVGVIDRLFSRVGAADDLARGRSTFMVEMVETAAILHQSTDRSFVILDEIGRGTATFDGLSIAWATLEHLHDVNRCRGLFATHYHELTALCDRLKALKSHTMRVKEWQGDVVFLHEVAAGAADRSYGIHVARLAGLPGMAVTRAEQVLAVLERGEQSGQAARVLTDLAEDLPLFAAAMAPGVPATPAITPPITPEEADALAALKALDPDSLPPRAALEELYRLRALLVR
ncbi:MAG: DNA mismatch repair protein MutS [Rhodospirillaceae bacterium]|nr:MAG: DNA mismatch repair protein MutS [Rhodospirillaceae bacterium]